MKSNVSQDHLLSIEGECKNFFVPARFTDVTPGGILGVALAGQAEKGSLIYCFGQDRFGPGSHAVDRDTVYDLASLTKPLVTALSCMLLVQRNHISLRTRITEILNCPSWGAGWQKVTVGQLLSHGTGLSAHRPFYVKALGRKKSERASCIQKLISSEPVLANNAEHIYSDLGYMILGFMIEKVTNRRLDTFFTTELANPLGLADDLFFPATTLAHHDKKKYAPTEVCPWSKVLLQGEVHDDNCRVMGGVAGHAGLFGTIRGVVVIGKILAELYGDMNVPGPLWGKKVREWSRRRPGTCWAVGFDTPSTCGSSSGNHFPAQSIGHLGFTGTSLWIDVTRGIVVALLTNRVNRARDREGIWQFRREVHDLVMHRMAAGSTATSPDLY